MENNNRKSGAGVSRQGSWLMMLRSLREFKKDALLTPITVMGEVVFEALIPYEIALLVNEVKAGCGLDRILHYAGILLLMALCALACGYVAGITCARASCGFASSAAVALGFSDGCRVGNSALYRMVYYAGALQKELCPYFRTGPLAFYADPRWAFAGDGI